jgi:hypothetical protein
MTDILRRALSALLLATCAAAASAQEAPPASAGQTLYLPIYSDLWHGDLGSRNQPDKTALSALVLIRNTDPAQPIRVVSARYHDSSGKLLRDFMPKARVVPPLGAMELFIERSESEGGTGASFLIRWQADRPANPPVVEAVHADLRNPRTVSFITVARPIRAAE